MLKLPPGQGFSIYSLAAVLPLLAAKQRVTDENDWMSSDAEVACPDPQLPDPIQDHPHRAAPLSPLGCHRHRVAGPKQRMMERKERRLRKIRRTTP